MINLRQLQASWESRPVALFSQIAPRGPGAVSSHIALTTVTDTLSVLFLLAMVAALV